MGFSSATVSVGGVTRQSEYQRVMDNTIENRDDIAALGGTWHKIADPPTGNLASKTSGWTADSFSGGLEVDFSDAISSTGVPVGSKAVRVSIRQSATKGAIFYRISGDANISNTPGASSEFSHRLMGADDEIIQAVCWLSGDYKVQFSVSSTATDLDIHYPIEYMI